MIAMSEIDRARIRRMTAELARSKPLSERIKAELRHGPATLAELCACVMPDMSEQSYGALRSSLTRMRKRGEIFRGTMQHLRGRRVQVAHVQVWRLASERSAAA